MGVIKKRLLFLPLIALLLVPTSASADFLTGYAAHKRGDYVTAFKEFKKSAQQGVANAQYNLGFMYANGRGAPQDYAQALKWYRKAAKQGNANAQSNLGVMYLKGQGVPQDYVLAAEWYRKAAKQGNANAQSNLGVMYVTGQGVPQDYVLAHMWINIAASHSTGEKHKLSSKVRDLIAKKMTPSQIAEAQKLAREWKPKKE